MQFFARRGEVSTEPFRPANTVESLLVKVAEDARASILARFVAMRQPPHRSLACGRHLDHRHRSHGAEWVR